MSLCQQSQRFTEIIPKYLKDDAITLRSVFSTHNTALDILPLSIYYGCLESVEWNGGMEQWNGILEWVQNLFKAITMKQMHYKWWNARTLK